MDCADSQLPEVLDILTQHSIDFYKNKIAADKYGQPNPCDTRAWSQILVSALANLSGLGRKKGADFNDGSDVKAANCWDAIDTPRFNGCIKAGTKAQTANSCASLDAMPHLFFVLWDKSETTEEKRCRVWVVRPQCDKQFRAMADRWYESRRTGSIKSDNFQLHPPRNLDNNVLRNNCGTLTYPLLLDARVRQGTDCYYVFLYDPKMLAHGECQLAI